MSFRIAELTCFRQQPTRKQTRIRIRRLPTQHVLALTQRISRSALPVEQPRKRQSSLQIIRSEHHRSVQQQARFRVVALLRQKPGRFHMRRSRIGHRLCQLQPSRRLIGTRPHLDPGKPQDRQQKRRPLQSVNGSRHIQRRSSGRMKVERPPGARIANFPDETVIVKMEQSRCRQEGDQNVPHRSRRDTFEKLEAAKSETKTDVASDKCSAAAKQKRDEPADASLLLDPPSIEHPDNRQVLHVVKNLKHRRPDQQVRRPCVRVPVERDAGQHQANSNRLATMLTEREERSPQPDNRNADQSNSPDSLQRINQRARNQEST